MRKVKIIKHLQEMLRSEADKIYRLNCQVEELENRLAQAEEKKKELHMKLTQTEIDLAHAEDVRNVALKFGNSMAEQYSGLCKSLSGKPIFEVCEICGNKTCDGSVCDFRWDGVLVGKTEQLKKERDAAVNALKNVCDDYCSFGEGRTDGI